MKHRRSFGLELPLVIRHVLPKLRERELGTIGIWKLGKHGGWYDSRMVEGSGDELWFDAYKKREVMLIKLNKITRLLIYV